MVGNNHLDTLITVFKSLSDIFTAGIAITTFSLFLYSLTFRIRDRLTNLFSGILFALMLLFGADAFGSVFTKPEILLPIVKVHWVGLTFIPSLYFHLSDALLALTGKPSRGKRRITGIILTLLSVLFLILLLTNNLLGGLVTEELPAPYLIRTRAMDLYLVFFIISIGFSLYNFIRAIRRTNSPTSKRRMIYLVVGAIGLLAGIFPFLIFESSFGLIDSLSFWFFSTILYMVSWLLLVVLTYAISFFGFSWPDREIKKRLFHWITRGPLTASLTLGISTLINRSTFLNEQVRSTLQILSMVATVVFTEHLLTLLLPQIERIFFQGRDLHELEKVRSLEERLFTRNDLKQFSEITLGSICDRVRIRIAVCYIRMNDHYEIISEVGDSDLIKKKVEKIDLQDIKIDETSKQILYWEGLNCIPVWNRLDGSNKKVIIAVIVFNTKRVDELDEDQSRAVALLLYRLRTAILDYQQQQSLLVSLDLMAPEMNEIQNLLAASRFTDIDQQLNLSDEEQMNKWTKDALSHLWGGPKLSSNPILQFSIVQVRAEETGETLTKTLREILRKAIESLRPEGERQYTNDWLLYNILNFKFIDNMKMRDIAKRLALSEADLYRKQRIAIESIAKKLIGMEEKSSMH